MTIAQVMRPDSDETHQANARLIAAAPELLAACQAALDCLDEILEDTATEGSDVVDMVQNPLLAQLRDAIAKANATV